MSDIQVPNGSSSRDDNAKTSALIAYGLLAFGLFTGLFWIIGGIGRSSKKRMHKARSITATLTK